MDQNSDEQKQRHQDLKTASTWIVDAREWAKLAKHLHTATEALPNDEPPHPNKLSVAQACIATAFQLTYNALLVAEAKWPRQDDSLETSNNRLKGDTQNELQTFIAHAGCSDTNRLLKDLDYYLHDYMAPTRQYYEDGSEQNAIHEFQIASLSGLLEQLIVIAERNLTDPTNTALSVKLNSEEAVAKVLKKIEEIVRSSQDGDYIYRGESQYYDKISSTLYRHYERYIQSEHFKIEIAQDEMFKEAEGFVQKTSDSDLLTQLQHFGGKTNLIDFSTDYLVALFFACDGLHDEDGRIFLLKQTAQSKDKYGITTPRSPLNRVISQKSVFARPPDGFIVPDHEICIPAYLKAPVLNYLRKYHGVSTNTIYNDLHGFIKHQDLHKNAHLALSQGMKSHHDRNWKKAIRHYNEALQSNPQYPWPYYNRGLVYQSQHDYSRAIEDYNKAIEFKPDFREAYFNRGLAYYDNGQHEFALQDFNRAIQLDPRLYKYYCYRGLAHLALQDWDATRSDLTTANNLGIDIVAASHERYPTISHLEEKIGAAVPEDIANMLGYTQSPGETSN